MQKLSTEQAAALSAIGAWLREYQKHKTPQYLTLGGYAGTGKTTLLAALRSVLATNQPELKLAFGAFTGKATQVLKKRLSEHKIAKRADSISTLHGLMYYSESKPGEPPKWRKRTHLKYDLIIIDEASMVSEDLWRDLLSFGKPILAVGDHGQLPPIGSQFNLMAEPQIRLERIWRQASGSPIIALATQARTSGAIEHGDYGTGVQKLRRAEPTTGDVIENILQSTHDDTMVLCGYNHTRHKLNAHVRNLLGIESQAPVPGDKIVCLRNNRDSGLSNGQVGIVEECSPAPNDKHEVWWYITANFDGTKFAGCALREQFGATNTASRLPRRPKGELTGLFDFGYALTVHKAQGSQARRVLVFEERFSKMDDGEWRRWLYTAVTRAQEELYIIG